MYVGTTNDDQLWIIGGQHNSSNISFTMCLGSHANTYKRTASNGSGETVEYPQLYRHALNLVKIKDVKSAPIVKLLEKIIKQQHHRAQLLDWCSADPDVSERGYFPRNRSTFQRHFKNSGLKALKEKRINGEDVPTGTPERLVDEFLRTTETNKVERTKPASDSCRYLSRDEEAYVIQSVVLLAACGHPVDEADILDMCNRVIGGDHRVEAEATPKLVRTMFEKYPSLKFLSAASLDPQRAAQAGSNVRDAFFTKLDCFVYLLHKMGVWEYKRAADVPPECWYNFDEVATDPTKHKKKVLVDVSAMMRLFQITPEGDRMNSHVTAGIFSRADGRYRFPAAGVEGAPGPAVVHADPSLKGKSASAAEKAKTGELNGAKQSPSDPVEINPRFLTNLGNPEAQTSHERNPLGVLPRTTASGSVTQERFLDLAIHFVQSLPEDQKGKPVILLVDGKVASFIFVFIGYLQLRI